MRNRNRWLALAALLAIATTGGACAEDSGPPPADSPPPPLPDGKCYVIDFGPTRVVADAGSRGTTREISVRNVGDDPMLIASIELEAPFFSDVPSSGLTLAPGAAAEIRFAFRPTALGTAEATADIAYREDSFCVRLVGEGVHPAFTCVPSTVNFGNVEAGRIRESEVVCTNHTVLDTLVRVPRGMAGDDPEYFGYRACRTKGSSFPPAGRSGFRFRSLPMVRGSTPQSSRSPRATRSS